jgi:hypothetical protein
MERRHGSDIFVVRSYPGAECCSDHYLVRKKYREKISNVRNIKAQKQTRFSTGVLKSEGSISEQFEDKINEMMENTQPNSENRTMEEKWQRCRTVMATAAEQVLRIEKKKKSNDWYDECERLVKERDVARVKMLQRRTRTTVREYANKRRLANRECRKKKRMFEKSNLENIEGNQTAVHENRPNEKRISTKNDLL